VDPGSPGARCVAHHRRPQPIPASGQPQPRALDRALTVVGASPNSYFFFFAVLFLATDFTLAFAVEVAVDVFFATGFFATGFVADALDAADEAPRRVRAASRSPAAATVSPARLATPGARSATLLATAGALVATASATRLTAFGALRLTRFATAGAESATFFAIAGALSPTLLATAGALDAADASACSIVSAKSLARLLMLPPLSEASVAYLAVRGQHGRGVGFIVMGGDHDRPPKVRDLPAPRRTESAIGPLFRTVFKWPYRVALAGFYRAGFRPWQLTALSLAANVVAGWLLVQGDRLVPGLLLIVAGLFDIFDGSLARLRAEASRWGAFLDSVLDRVSDMVLFGALFWSLAGRGDHLPAALALSTLIVSTLVSHIRAEAEAMGLSLTEGFMQRLERYVLLMFGLIVPGTLTPVLAVLTVLGILTVLQRGVLAWDQLAKGTPTAGEEKVDKNAGSI